MSAHLTQDNQSAALEQLCEALERIGDALAAVDMDGLLAAEPRLGSAMSALAAAPLSRGDRSAKPKCERARAALLRSRRLGVSFSRAARAMAGVGTPADRYDRSGAYVEGADLRAALQVRI